MSVRMPVRPTPPSPPRISRFTRSRPCQGSFSVTLRGAVAVTLEVNTVSTRSAWVIAYRIDWTTGSADTRHASTTTAPAQAHPADGGAPRPRHEVGDDHREGPHREGHRQHHDRRAQPGRIHRERHEGADVGEGDRGVHREAQGRDQEQVARAPTGPHHAGSRQHGPEQRDPQRPAQGPGPPEPHAMTATPWTVPTSRRAESGVRHLFLPARDRCCTPACPESQRILARQDSPRVSPRVRAPPARVRAATPVVRTRRAPQR